VAALLALNGCDLGDGDGSGRASREGGTEGGSAAPSDAPGVPGDGDPADVRVIQAWSDTLRAGDVQGAAGFFAVPSVAENGPQLLRIRTHGDARLFNASLPCGAILRRAEGEGDFTTATFELTERPGPGACGPGTGETAFVIEDGEIAEWRRVAVVPESAPGEAI
jgi:hypothetical protein